MKTIAIAFAAMGVAWLVSYMIVPCAVCGVNMTTAEVTQRPYDGVVGNYHRDCAYLAYAENLEIRTWLKSEITKSKNKLSAKHAGTLTDFP